MDTLEMLAKHTAEEYAYAANLPYKCLRHGRGEEQQDVIIDIIHRCFR